VQTQKDHVEAYSFLMGRTVSALVLGDASQVEVPARRAWNGLVIGAAVAALIATGFFVYGLLLHFTAPNPSSPAPQVSGVAAQMQPTGQAARALLPGGLAYSPLWR
jgi:Type VII secretion system ESX-1, transport TM domain B